MSNNKNWKEESGALHRSIKTDGYAEAVATVVNIAMVADKQNHHPTMTIGYNTVDIMLTTHDQGNTITDKDRKLARAIDDIV